MTSQYNDEEIILEFINIFASLETEDKASLLARVLGCCPQGADAREVLRDLDSLVSNPSEDTEIIDTANESPKLKACSDIKQCLPADLQSLIISTNPQLNIQFILSSRLNTQMLYGGFLLNKRRFYTTSTGVRTASWRCVVGGCSYHALTSEGELKDAGLDTHNHEKIPDLLLKKEARIKLIDKIVEGADTSKVVQEAGTDMLGVVGGIAAIRQAANRRKKKLVRTQNLLKTQSIKLETQDFVVKNSKFENANDSFNYDLLKDDSFNTSEVEMDLDEHVKRTNTPEEKFDAGSTHCLPDDLQSLIIFMNPEHDIKFTLSSRMNTQISVSGFLLKKKRLYRTNTGLRSVSWKCVVRGCPYHALTVEGRLKHSDLEIHNHQKVPELFKKKEARLSLIQNIVDGEKASDVMKMAGEDILGLVGGAEAIKQAARRLKRKLSVKMDPLLVKLEEMKGTDDNYQDSYIKNL